MSNSDITKYNNAIVTPTTKQGFKIYGAVYGKENNQYQVVKCSQRWCGDKYTPDDPQILNNRVTNNIRTIQEPSLYLGHLTTHYGHFLMETLLRFWAIDKLREGNKPFKYIVFNPWFLRGFGNRFNGFLPFIILLKVFGLTMSNVIVVDRLTKFDTLYVPVPMGKLAPPQFEDHQNIIFDKIVNYCNSATPLKQFDDKIYISRKYTRLRSITNEAQIEKLFKNKGFQIVYMEKLPFVNQVAIISHAKIVAGFSGSGMHNTIFTKNATVLMLSGRLNGNPFQSACDKLRNNNLIVIKNQMQGNAVNMLHLSNYIIKNSHLFN